MRVEIFAKEPNVPCALEMLPVGTLARGLTPGYIYLRLCKGVANLSTASALTLDEASGIRVTPMPAGSSVKIIS
jgi:hypothetical protein